MRREALARAWQPALVLAVCLVVYWLMLGSRPFSMSEGHRVVPGWTMLRTGEAWRVEMFGQPYFRKPPGMPWAIAGSSAVLGETQLAARVPSALAATLMALAAFAFATRWFGSPFGLFSGLAQALTPLFWMPGRSAEIEALHTLGAQLACLGLVEVLAGGRRRGGAAAEPPRHSDPGESGMRLPVSALAKIEEPGLRPPSVAASVACVAVIAAGLCIAAATKGPASGLAIGGVIVGACLAARSARPLASGWAWGAFALAAAVLVPVGLRVLRANDVEGVIAQETGDFRWTRPLVEIAALPLVAFAAALPASLALLFPFGGDARREAAADRSPHAARAWLIARTLALGWVCGVAGAALAGIGNARYAMPSAILLPPLVAYVARGAWRFDPPFTPVRRRIARTLAFRNPAAWPVLLVAAATIGLVRQARVGDGPSGPRAGAAIAACVPAGATVWADDLVEARPDALLYAERASAAGGGGGIDVRWKKTAMLAGEAPPSGAFIAVRTDGGSGERARYAGMIERGWLRRVGGGVVGRYEFEVYRVEGEGGAGAVVP